MAGSALSIAAVQPFFLRIFFWFRDLTEIPLRGIITNANHLHLGGPMKQKLNQRPRLCSLAALGLLLAFLTGLFTGCAPRQAKQVDFRLVTSFYPMYIIALNVTEGVEGVEVSNMAGQQTGCLHDYQLQNKDMKNLETADAFLINGAGMESFLDKVLEQMPELPVINASEGIELLCAEEDHDHEGHEHEEEEYNAHVWVSISNYMQQVETVTSSLMELDPERAGQYRDNGDAYLKKLSALREQMHQELDGLPNREIVTFHEAFPYFAEEFNLHIAAVVNREPDSQPSARELADTIRLIRDTGVTAVFAEPQYSESAAQVISGESGATLYLLDPGVTGEEDPDAYLHAMEKNLEILKEALA